MVELRRYEAICSVRRKANSPVIFAERPAFNVNGFGEVAKDGAIRLCGLPATHVGAAEELPRLLHRDAWRELSPDKLLGDLEAAIGFEELGIAKGKAAVAKCCRGVA